MEIGHALIQGFLSLGKASNISSILVNVADDILFAGIIEAIKHSFGRIRQRLDISKEIIDKPDNFN